MFLAPSAFLKIETSHFLFEQEYAFSVSIIGHVQIGQSQTLFFSKFKRYKSIPFTEETKRLTKSIISSKKASQV